MEQIGVAIIEGEDSFRSGAKVFELAGEHTQISNSMPSLIPSG